MRSSRSMHSVAQSDRQTLLILGATGDLTKRLLLPGLGGLLARDDTSGLTVIGSAVQRHSDGSWRNRIVDSFDTVNARGLGPR